MHKVTVQSRAGGFGSGFLEALMVLMVMITPSSPSGNTTGDTTSAPSGLEGPQHPSCQGLPRSSGGQQTFLIRIMKMSLSSFVEQVGTQSSKLQEDPGAKEL